MGLGNTRAAGVSSQIEDDSGVTRKPGLKDMADMLCCMHAGTMKILKYFGIQQHSDYTTTITGSTVSLSIQPC
jgi:hypothetical protein